MTADADPGRAAIVPGDHQWRRAAFGEVAGHGKHRVEITPAPAHGFIDVIHHVASHSGHSSSLRPSAAPSRISRLRRIVPRALLALPARPREVRAISK